MMGRKLRLDEWPGWDGWVMDEAGLWCPDWRRPFDPGEIRALPYTRASHRAQMRVLDQQRAELARTAAELVTVAERAAWYRRQVILEARYGLMFSDAGAE